MGYSTITGGKIAVFLPTYGAALSTGDSLQPNIWYETISFAASGSALPAPFRKIEAHFKTAHTLTSAITLVAGDSVKPMTLGEAFAKSNASLSAGQGVVEVTDDCDEGFVTNILDGYTTLSASLEGFLKYNDSTGEFSDQTKSVLKRFFDLVDDDGNGNYSLEAKANEKALIAYCMNRQAKSGQHQNWLIFSAFFESVELGGGLKEAQTRNLSLQKAPGPVSIYKRLIDSSEEL